MTSRYSRTDIHKYIAVFIDDLSIVARYPKILMDAFEKKYKLNLKGTGTISFHLGCYFFRDSNGV